MRARQSASSSAALRFADHVGHHHLAPFAVRPADDGNLAHRAVGEQHLLDLARIDVGTARDDQVLGAVLEMQITLLVDNADVAGMQKAAAHAGRARLRVLPIAGHDDAAAEDFARFARRHRPILVVGHPDLDA